MVRHVILWTLKDEYSGAQIEEIKRGIKIGLEGLKGQIPGLTDIHVYTNGLSGSNADLMLDSYFEDEASLRGYAVHPMHVKVANEMVRSFTATRTCLDFEV